MKNNPWDNFNEDNKFGSANQQQGKPSNSSPNNNKPNMQDLFKKILSYLKQNRNYIAVMPTIAVLIVIWVASGLYIVDPEQQAIVTRFGRYIYTSGPGLRYHLPYPIEKITKNTVTRINTLKIGYDGSSSDSRDRAYKQVSNNSTRLVEGLMLTNDENIIDIQFEVQWKIKDLKAYIFNVKAPTATISNVSQSAIREVIAQNLLAEIITNGRYAIEGRVKEMLQQILDYYQSGVEIVLVQMLKADPPTPVIDAFRDVQTAKVDRVSEINRAEAYKNNVIPRAKGAAQKMINESEAYASETIQKAKGYAKSFDFIYTEYSKNKILTKQRLRLDMIEKILSEVDKIIIDEKLSKSGVLPYLPLDGKMSSGTNSSPGGSSSPSSSEVKPYATK